jgi:AAA+ superfamily predicted ATPase
MAARALGAELSLPTYVVRFDAVIGAYLGQTAIHLRELFRYAERTPCVLVFDEIDALGKKRGSPLDVGELDRIVISMMLDLEHCQARGLIVATTNLAVNLDIALWRRFDLCLEFPRPSRAQLRSYVSRLAARSRFRLPREVRKTAVSARSFADAERIVQGAVRRKVLQGG